MIELRKNQLQLVQQFQDFLKSPEVTQLVAQLRQTTGGEGLDLEKYGTNLQDNLKRLQQDAVILYPFVLDDRLELVLITPYSPPIIGNETFNFSGLKYAGVEVENLGKTVPSTTPVVDKQFNQDTIVQMNDYSVVHLATHAAFVTGQPEESFILFGDGSRATLRDVGGWRLPNVDLIVLSACETDLGDKLGDGKEVLGFGYQMQQTGARAAIASLWQVNDGGTQALMNAFYAALEKGNITKAEALRQAQIALITGDYKALGEQ